MPSRAALAELLQSWVGSDALELVNAGNGWPAFYRARTTSSWVPLAAYIGPIGHSQRGREDLERRFQNPGKNRPILEQPGAIPVLLGLYESSGSRVLVGMEVSKRVGKTTRQSLFMPLHLLRSTDAWGWAEHFSDAGEKLIAFRPNLLPIYVELQRSGVDVESSQIEQIVFAAGASDNESGVEAAERAIASVSRLVRQARFSLDVRLAYEGRCALCGLDLMLVEGAHIYPVSAPGSTDEVWNGIALCRNHHAVFDTHLIRIDASTGIVHLHPDLLAETTHGCRAFVQATFDRVVSPKRSELRPKEEMFEMRYDYFKPKYSWL